MESGSSQSSVAEAQGAMELLITLLLNDNIVTSNCVKGLESISPNRFERNLRRLLTALGVGLRKVATETTEKDAARFIRYRARNTAHMLRNHFVPVDMPKSNDFRPSASAKGVQRGELDEDEDSSDSDDDRDSSISNLEQLESFILNSLAFDTFRRDLGRFVRSETLDKSSHDGVDTCEKEADTGTPMDATLTLLPDTLPTPEQMQISQVQVVSALASSGSPNTDLQKRTRSTIQTSINTILSSTISKIQLYRESELHAGKVRIRWKCVSKLQSSVSLC